MSGYTPGPWCLNTAGSGGAVGNITLDEYYVYKPNVMDDVAIASDIIDPITSKPSEANARLIAASPQLLEALQAIVASLAEHDDEGMIEHAKQMVAARAAIAKATGQQP